MDKRRCMVCRKMLAQCDLFDHPRYGFICKICYDNIIKE